MEEYGRTRQATDDDIILRMRVACWITKATDKRGICGVYCFSAAIMVTLRCPDLKVKGSPRPARNIRSDSETFAANFFAEWNVHGDKWLSPYWREKNRAGVCETAAIYSLSLLARFFYRCHRDSAGFTFQFRELAPAGDKNVLCRQAPEGRSRQASFLFLIQAHI